MTPYVVPNVSQWQPTQVPYGNHGKMNPIGVQSNSQVTLLTSSNSPLHVSQMPQQQQQQQHLVHQGGPLLPPSVHGQLASATSMYTS